MPVTTLTAEPNAGIPSWYPGDEAKPAPMPLMLVQGFVNTWEAETGLDLLDDRDTARRWLVDAGLLDRDARFTDRDLAVAREVRESLRALLMANGGRTVPADQLEPLRSVADAGRPRLALAKDGKMSLESPSRSTVQDALFELLLVVRSAQEDGSWGRLKACANPDCHWAYFDRSRNQQGSWCDMAVCGNRLKNRQLRARRG